MSIFLPELDPHDPRWTKRGATHVRNGEGPTYWAAGDTYTLKITAAETNGSLGFVEASVPAGAGPIPHVHNHTDEAFYLLSGELEFLDGDQEFVAGPGDFIFVPRGHRHRFRNIGTQTAKLLFLFTPGGVEGAQATGIPARPGVAPPPTAELTPEEIGRVVEIARRFDTEMMP